MKTKQLVFLCVCNLAMYTVGNGLVAMVPVYAIRLGTDPGAIGSFLALAFLGITAGSVAGGRAADRFQRRKLIVIVGGVLFAGSILLLREVTTFTGLVIAAVVTWFLAGVVSTTISVLAGLFAGEARRGRVFGLLATCVPLGQIIAGVFSGQLVVRFGYPGMFLVAALVSMIVPLAALMLEDKVVAAPERKHAASINIWQSRAFLLLVGAYLTASVVSSLPGLVRPLLMDRLHFDEAAIASAVAIGGIVSLPLPLLMGWLSDHVGRRWLLVLCYGGNAAGLGLYISAVTLGQFWLATAVQGMVQGGSGVGLALITDLVPKAALGRAMAIYSSVQWIGFVIGLFAIGFAIEQFGTTNSLLGGVGLGIVSMLLAVLVVRPARVADVALDSAA